MKQKTQIAAVKADSSASTSDRKSRSCNSLHYAIYMAPNVLRHCCQRFFVNGQRRGDAEMYQVNSDEDVDVDKILQSKRDLYEAINRGEETQCSGCPYLSNEEWPSLDKLKINNLSIESQTHCNARCSYCNETYYGGLEPNYNLKATYYKFASTNVFSDDISIVWGGGEPLLMKDFEKIFCLYTDNLRPKHNRVFSNAILFSPLLATYLKERKIYLTTSIDAGTKETFRKVRGVDSFETVLKNLSKYVIQSISRVTIKYILTEDNQDISELNSFINELNRHGLSNCDFEISANYKVEEITSKRLSSVYNFYTALINNGASSVHFDDHLRKRLHYKITEIYDSYEKGIPVDKGLIDEISSFHGQEVIVWGTGGYASELIENSIFFQKTKIAFFIDSNINKQGRYFKGKKIYSPDAVRHVDFPIVIASSIFWQEIRSDLESEGVNNERVVSSCIF